MYNLRIGDSTEDGSVMIIDEDRLCYLIKNTFRNVVGIRTISKAIVGEFIAYAKQNPNANAQEAREALTGTSQIDRFEYGYCATLLSLAKLSIQKSKGAISDNIPILESSSVLQQIFYGAPGTGKSHEIKRITKGEQVIRTTFHPDSDYSTFVGAYKPTTKEVTLRDLNGKVVEENGQFVKEEKIVYEFVQQAFLQAYTNAWKYYAEAKQGETPKKQYLVIEEINRGNCAQIFGDIFQLLDRNDFGFSDYPIKADNDMKKQLSKAFAGQEIPQCEAINALYDEDDVVKQVMDGDILLLPNNLFIWATMNTSDQSLFPIDSAFKRRWDWKYMPIHNANKKWRIVANGAEYDWWQFLEKVNEYIGSITNSEDKKLGYFFCKPKNEKIDAETFVGKVCFYLWNDVFKNYGIDGELFKAADDTILTYDKFYEVDNIKEENIAQFLKNLGLTPLQT